jgi:hypothetical protein
MLGFDANLAAYWMPACAGMTENFRTGLPRIVWRIAVAEKYRNNSRVE